MKTPLLLPLFAGLCFTATCVPATAAVNYEPYTFSTIAGEPPGRADGPRDDARFNLPSGTDVDADGNVFVTDGDNNTIRKITPAGVVSTIAGSAGKAGTADGTGAQARFSYPSDVAVAADGNMYVTDYFNHTIRKITPAGVVSTFAGVAGKAGNHDGTGSAARFTGPTAIAIDGDSNLYVTDSFDRIRKITPAAEVSTIAGGGFGTGDAQFLSPQGIAVDLSGNVYVTCLDETVRKVTPAGFVTILAGSPQQQGKADGKGAAARFNSPWGVDVNANGTLFVADQRNQTIRKITPAGVVTTVAGRAGVIGSKDATGAAAAFYYPSGISLDDDGNAYVADASNDLIRKVTPAGVVTRVAGNPGGHGNVNGSVNVAQFTAPTAIAFDHLGNVYVAEQDGRVIRKITPAGKVSNLAGKPGTRGKLDGAGNKARFSDPLGVAVDSTRNVYVADYGNHTIRKITPAGVVTTFAGQAGVPGSTNGTGNEALFSYPTGVAVDGEDNVFVVDNGTQIRKITPERVVTTFAGSTEGGNEDGIGSAARFSGATGIAANSSGVLFVSSQFNHTIRKITPDATVTTFAGTAGKSGHADAVGAEASFYGPWGLAVDGAGNVYVADASNATIRKIRPGGKVTTLGGVPRVFGAKDGTGKEARFNVPTGMALDGEGNLYLTDQYNRTISLGVK